jgi:poly(3-hydroxybutyrate) depolymerase
MKKVFFIPLILLVGLTLSVGAIYLRKLNSSSSNPKQTSQSPKQQREILEFRSINQPKKLVIALHGAKSGAAQFAKTLKVEEAIANENIVVVLPNGLNQEWNDARSDSYSKNDTNYLQELIEKKKLEYNISTKDTWLIGVSNGGMMAQTLSCQNPNLASNLISIVANFSEQLVQSCKQISPNVLHVVGQKDDVMPFEGGEIKSDRKGKVVSALQTFEIAKNILKCQKLASQNSNFKIESRWFACGENKIGQIVYKNHGHITTVFQQSLEELISSFDMVNIY